MKLAILQKKYLFVFTTIVLFFNLVFASDRLELNEEVLKDYINDNVPSIEKLNTIYERSIQSEKAFYENYIFNLNGSSKYYDLENSYGKEDNLSYDLNVSKKFIYGNNLKVGTKNTINAWNFNSGYNNYFFEGSQPYINIEYSMNLWKNFLGYSDLSKKLSIEQGINEARIKRDIEKNLFFINIRKIYWSLVANEKRIKVYEKLIEQAEKNLKNTESKFKLYTTSKGDIAKANASLSSRKSDLENLKVSKQNLLQKLVYLLPELENKELFVKSDVYNEEFLKSFVSCLVDNDKLDDYTLYTDYMNSMSNKIDANIKSLNRYDDLNLDLVAGADVGGRDKNFRKSYGDINNSNFHNYYVGLNFSVPFGKTKNDSKLQQVKILKMEHNSTVNDIKSNIIATQNNFGLTIKYLFEQLKNSKNNINNLTISVSSKKNKYEQGRISLKDLIDEEDLLLQAYLGIFNIEYSIINTTLDYLSVFQKSECKFNLK